ncbi:MAG: hypothetical protein EOO43_01620 [Flavobacterium sp.]|nr:MAG: hypothetical protein EOO43_01620 [Flavobacterium sp.]
MQVNYSPLLALVIKYNNLLTRYALRHTGGNTALADRMVKEAMEEAYDENKFYDTKELRQLLKHKIDTRINPKPAVAQP